MLRQEPRVEATRMMISRDTADGSPAEMPVYLARPAGSAAGKRPGLILIQEIFGVNPHIQDVTRRFAAAGYVVVAPDIFYRTAHWLSFNYDQVADVRPIVSTLTEDLVVGDLQAAFDCLAAQPDVDPDRLGVVGYCFGGRMSFVSASRFPDRVKAVAIYYGGGIAVTASGTPPIDRVGQIACPVIAFYGALDKHIPREHVEKLSSALDGAGVNNQVYYYPYADHGFFCDARAQFHPRAAEDAWHRTLWFFSTHLGPVPAAEWD